MKSNHNKQTINIKTCVSSKYQWGGEVWDALWSHGLSSYAPGLPLRQVDDLETFRQVIWRGGWQILCEVVGSMPIENVYFIIILE